jgi:hypothetical protein
MSEYEDMFRCCDGCTRNVVHRYAHMSDIQYRPNLGHTLCQGCFDLMTALQDQRNAHNGRVILEASGITGITTADFPRP